MRIVDPEGVRVVAATREELGGIQGAALGVGMVAAAAAAAKLIEAEDPSAVILVGSAGSYATGPAPGALIVSKRVGLASTAAALGLGYVPREPSPIATEEGVAQALQRGSGKAKLAPIRADVLSTLAITTDPGLSTRHGHGWQVEHLEAYGVAHACAAAGVAFCAVLGIANRVGPDAHKEWLQHRAQAERQACRLVERLLSER
jgi:purine-nucleoside phosphorylase